MAIKKATQEDLLRLPPVEHAAGMMLQVLQAALNGIVFSLEAKDEYSSQHSIRVAEMSEALARALGRPELMCQTVFTVASVHDIGKIGIPDAILLAGRRLTEEEWQVMRTHPDIGADILAKTIAAAGGAQGAGSRIAALLAEQMGRLESGIRHHHERWDGAGYPAGLAGAAIPEFSRIIALCDSTDAMLSNRRYRKALPVEVCRTEIEKNSGKMYDPALAAVFLAQWEQIVTPVYAADRLQPGAEK